MDSGVARAWDRVVGVLLCHQADSTPRVGPRTPDSCGRQWHSLVAEDVHIYLAAQTDVAVPHRSQECAFRGLERVDGGDDEVEVEDRTGPQRVLDACGNARGRAPRRGASGASDVMFSSEAADVMFRLLMR